MAQHDDLGQPWEVMDNDIYTMVLSTPTSGGRRDSIKSSESISGPSEHSSFSGSSSVCQWSPSTPDEMIPMDYKIPMQQYNIPITPMSKFGPVLPGQFMHPNFDYQQSYEPKRLLSDDPSSRNDSMQANNFSFTHSHDATAFTQPSCAGMTALPSPSQMRPCNDIQSSWLHQHDGSLQARNTRMEGRQSSASSFCSSESPSAWSNYTASSANTVNPWHVGGITKHSQQSDFNLDANDHQAQAGQIETIDEDVEYEFVDTSMGYNTKKTLSPSTKLPPPSRRRRKPSQIKVNAKLGCPLSETGTNDHKCGTCSRAFRRREHLKRHQKTAHGEVKPFTCAVGAFGGSFCKILDDSHDKTSGKRRNPGISRSDNQIQHYKTHLKNGRNACFGREMVYWLVRKYEKPDRANKIITSLEETWHSPDFKRGKVNEEKVREHKDYTEFIRDARLKG